MSEAERRKWNERYATEGPTAELCPSPFVQWLVADSGLVKGAGRALDVAAGQGRNALYLASRGFHVDAVDISDIGLARLREGAEVRGVAARITTYCRDLDTAPRRVLFSRNRYDLAICVDYKNPELAWTLTHALKPGGLLGLELAGYRNLEINPRPSARYLVDDDEIASWFPSLEQVAANAEWRNARYVVRYVGRRPVSGAPAAS